MMSQAKRIAVLWCIILLLFAAFNAVYWPIRSYQKKYDPANFLDQARGHYLSGNVPEAVETLRRGIADYHPSDPHPYRLLAELASKAGKPDLNAQAELSALFYGAQREQDAAVRDATLQRATELYLRAHHVPEFAPKTNGAILRLAVDLTAVFGAGRAVLDMSPQSRFALLAIAGGDLRTDGVLGDTGVTCPVDLLVQSGGGQGVQRVAHIIVDGRDLAERKRGIHTALISASTGQILHWNAFDLFDDVTAAERMAQFLRDAPQGCIGAFAVCDDGSVNMTQELENELLGFGLRRAARVDRELALAGLRYSLAAIGVKGAAQGTALQSWSPERFGSYDGHPAACGVLRPGSGQ